MTEVTTDVNALRVVSSAVDILGGQPSINDQQIIRELIHSLPDGAYGLAAPQINYFKRMFVANLPNIGMHVFINPKIVQSDGQAFSTEGCLSIPNEKRSVWRSESITVESDIVYKVNVEQQPYAFSIPFDQLVSTVSTSQKFIGDPAIILQHEIDHLNGVLLIDLENFVLSSEEVVKKEQARREKIQKKRLDKKSKNVAPQKVASMNQKRAAKIKIYVKQANKMRKRQIEIEAYHNAIKAGIIEDNTKQDIGEIVPS